MPDYKRGGERFCDTNPIVLIQKHGHRHRIATVRTVHARERTLIPLRVRQRRIRSHIDRMPHHVGFWPAQCTSEL